MKDKKNNLFNKIFKNKKGAIVIWQYPNIPLWGWILSTLVAIAIKHSNVHNGFQHMADASLVIWAYLEIRSGESLFRRILGGIVMAVTIYGFFKSQ